MAIVDDDYGLIFQYPRLDRFLWNSSIISINETASALSVSSTGSFSLELHGSVFIFTVDELSVSSTGSFSLELYPPRMEQSPRDTFSILDWIVFSGTFLLIQVQIPGQLLSVSSTGSFSLEHPTSCGHDALYIIFQYPRLDRFLWNFLSNNCIVFSVYFQYPRLDRFLWNYTLPLEVDPEKLFQYPRLDRFLWNPSFSRRTTAKRVLSVSSTGSFSLELVSLNTHIANVRPFSILDWIVFSGTLTGIKRYTWAVSAFSILDWIVFSGTGFT